MDATASTLPAPAHIAGRSLLGMTDFDRRRMLEMEERIRPVRAITMAALALAVLASGAWIGYWTIVPVIAIAAGFVIADWISRRVRYPEYAIMTAWVLSQVAIGVAVALTGGPDSPILVVAAMPIVSLSARFPVRVVAGGVGITLVDHGRRDDRRRSRGCRRRSDAARPLRDRGGLGRGPLDRPAAIRPRAPRPGGRRPAHGDAQPVGAGGPRVRARAAVAGSSRSRSR